MAKSNKQIQTELDKIKWESSEFMGKDMSGRMDYCDWCDEAYSEPDDNSLSSQCCLTHDEREKNCVCAKAYKAMIKAKKESK